MFQKKTVKTFSIVAIILSVSGLLLSVTGAFFIHNNRTFAFFMGIVSWAILLWASIAGYKLCTSYKLDDEEYKKVGLRIYAIIIAFILFFFIGIVAGIAISVIILSAIWGLKRNYDEWEYKWGNDTTANDTGTSTTAQETNTNDNDVTAP